MLSLRNSDIIFFTVVYFIFLLLLFGTLFYFAVRYRKKKLENEKNQKVFEEQLATSRLEIQEQTFQFISRELHDNIGQLASLLKIYITTLKSEKGKNLEEKIEDADQLASNLITDIKTLSTTLNTNKLLKMELTDAVNVEAKRINRLGLINADVHIEGIPKNIESNRRIIIFRMVQEILNNIVQHANAKNISIHLNYLHDLLRITVEDDGSGFDIQEVSRRTNGSGNGLINLQNRAQALKGNLQIKSAVGKGTTSIIDLPV